MSQPPTETRRGRRAWLLLALAVGWAALIRVPLVVNAPVHLDSDLAVDGLTLREAAAGHWRWHYPGTPHIGTPPVLLSLPQALVFGATPETLVSGGTVAWLGLMLATFLLADCAFGPGVAAWSLLPLSFASTGALWLSARITGGHLVAAGWHAAAYVLLYRWLSRDRPADAAWLGLWCGAGLYVDSMFLVTLAGLVPAAVIGATATGPGRRRLLGGAVFTLALLAGIAPREVGARAEPYDAYREQFRPILRRDVLLEHARILACDCLPRLVAGHRLPRLESDPNPALLGGAHRGALERGFDPLGAMVVAAGLTSVVVAGGALLRAALGSSGMATRAVAGGLLLSSAAMLAGFVLNRNIFNSDNYRYLVDGLVPLAVGVGIALHELARRGQGGVAAAALLGLLWASLMTADAFQWYARFGWIDRRGWPVRQPLRDPALAWLEAHPEVRHIYGDYWDVYRLAFLSGEWVRGTPSAIFPDRYPEWRARLPRGHPETVLVRYSREGRIIRDEAERGGARVVDRGKGFEILSWP